MFYLGLLHNYEAEKCRILLEIESPIAYSSRDGTVSPPANGFPKHTIFMSRLRSQWLPKVTNLQPRWLPDGSKDDQVAPLGTTRGSQVLHMRSKVSPWGAKIHFVGRPWAPSHVFRVDLGVTWLHQEHPNEAHDVQRASL